MTFLQTISDILHSPASWFLLPLVGNLRWWEVQPNPDLYNAGDFSAYGVSNPGMMPNRAQWTSLNQAGGFDENGPLMTASGTGGERTYHFGDNPNYNFSGGGMGGPSGGASGGTTGGSFGTASGPSSINAVTGAGDGAGGAGGAMAGGSWWSNPQVWGAVLGAGSSYLEQQQANRNAQQANQPRPYSNQTTPWGPATSNLEFGMAEALRRYQNQGGGPPGGGGRGGRGGGGGGGGPAGPNTALSPQMQGLLDSMVSRGTSTPDYITSAQQDAAGMISGGGSNPYLQGTYDQASDYRNPYNDQFIQSMMGAYAPGGTPVRNGANRNGQASGHYASGSGGGGGDAGYTPNQWLRESLDGRWLNEGNPEMDALLATMARETSQDYLNNLAPSVDAEFIRGGRYGSDSYAHAQAMAAEQFGETLAGQQAQVRYGNYNDERGRMQDSLGLMTQGELGAMQAAAQRDSAASSAGASRYATDMQGDIANRGLLLDAIRGVSSDDMNRMGLMGQMAGQFGDERLGALNAIPGLEEASWMGPTAGWGAGMDAQNRSDQILLHNQQRSDQQRAQQQANATRRWQMSQEMDNQRFNDLMRWSLATGEAFGQTSGVNTPGQYVPQGSTGAAALQGGIGGYMFGSGLRNG